MHTCIYAHNCTHVHMHTNICAHTEMNLYLGYPVKANYEVSLENISFKYQLVKEKEGCRDDSVDKVLMAQT